MSMVEFLKSIGAVSLPDDVIKLARRSKEKVQGRLLLTKYPNGNVLMTFTPNQGEGNSRPLLAKDAEQAESDLVATFGLPESQARAQIAELERKGEVNVAASVEEGLASELFLYR